MRHTNNSQCEFYLAVLCGVYHDLVSAIIPQSEIKRDLQEIANRTRSEGIGFLTKTLPKLGKALDRALGTASKLQFQSFKKAPGTELPAFGRQLFSLVFTREGLPRHAKPGENSCRETVEHLNPGAGSGNASNHRSDAAVMALRALRQILYLCYKIELPYRADQVDDVLDRFIATEQELKGFFPRKLGGPQKATIRCARHLICRVLANCEPLGGIPKHGPGSVSTGEKSPEKHRFRRLYKRLDRTFPWTEWFMTNANHVSEHLDELQRLPEHKFGRAKVILVPKDSRGPRLISAEPLEYQWVQQALLAVLVPTIESHPLTRGHVNFTSQEVNRRLALEGSSTGRWVTLDMKDASDRVSLRLVHSLFPARWFQAIYASRTPVTVLPSGQQVTMRKCSPMGSAVCFPIEALVFWSLSVAALMIHKHMPLRKAASRVFVYGDDIITDAEDHSIIVQQLEACALKANADKCCTGGFFRESCGMDAFMGSSVTPLKLRKPWSATPKPSTLASYIEFSNSMYARGCYVVAEIVERYLQELTCNSIPIVSDRAPAIHCFVRTHYTPTKPQPSRVQTRWNPRLQRREVRGLALKSKSIMTETFGYPLLLRILCRMEWETAMGKSPSSRPKYDATGQFPMAHWEQPTRAWTPLV